MCCMKLTGQCLFTVFKGSTANLFAYHERCISSQTEIYWKFGTARSSSHLETHALTSTGVSCT